MKAILFPKYGPPDVLQLTEVEKPTPNENQVLIKVIAASANPLDWHRMRGEPLLARMGTAFASPRTKGWARTSPGRWKQLAKVSRSFSRAMRYSESVRAVLPSMRWLAKVN